MKKLLHYHFPLWVLLSLVFLIVSSVTLTAIASAFSKKLEQTLRTEMSNQLNEMKNRLEASDYDSRTLAQVEDEGTHILIYDRKTGTVRYRSKAGVHIAKANARSAAEGDPDRPASPQEETTALLVLTLEELGNETGSFLFSDSKTDRTEHEEGFESREIYLCWQSETVVGCLCIPLQSTNEAVKEAILLSQRVSVSVWLFFLILFVHITKKISNHFRRFAEMASRMARLDFSRRCPENIIREMNDLGVSINTMADALEEHVKALQDANEKLNIELAERIRQQKSATDLMGNLAHDLKTPIAIVSGYAEGLVEGLAKTPEKQKDYCDCIMLESNHMQEIVSRILALGRMENGVTPIHPRDFDLRPLLNEILSSFQREIERQGLQLTRFGGGRCMVHSDFDCVRQSLINYVQNAIYHINNGKRIEVRIEDRGNRIRVRVVNSSAPIPEEQTQKIWEKLYRGDPSRQRKHGEMGLGLSIVKSNMERLGHPYGVENDPNFPGVCFWLELPKAERGGTKPESKDQGKQEETA